MDVINISIFLKKNRSPLLPALLLCASATLPAQIPGMPTFPGGGTPPPSAQAPSFSMPSMKKGRTVDPEILTSGEFWPDNKIQEENVDTGFATWHWELRIRADGNLEITRTKKSSGVMEGLASDTSRQAGLSTPQATSKPSQPGAVSIWKATHAGDHWVKCVVFDPASMHTRLLDWSPRNKGELINPITGALGNVYSVPSAEGFTLYHGALSAVMPDGTYKAITPADKEFEEDQKKLSNR